jgi:DNA-binding transcriptional regulator LsrR (DeoR family)
MAEVPNYLVGMSKPKAKFVSVMGSLTRSSAANLFEVVYHFAERTGGEGHFLPVPFIANTIADREIFMSQRVFKEILALEEQVSFRWQPLDRATSTASCSGIATSRVSNCKISSAQGQFATA